MRDYSLAEEIAHAATHGLGLLLSIAALVLLVVFATLRGDAWHIVSVSVYGGTLVLLYLASTLYHSIRHPPAKKVLQVIDHSAIYLLIAGTYTPITLTTLRGGWGYTLFGIVWSLALVGVLLEAFARKRLKVVSISLYLGLGWLAAVAVKPLFERVPIGGLALILLGGLAYTAGVGFYLWRKLPYHHAVWHVFVLVGSACHFLAVLLYVIPRV
jgi:hemolysin III